jgi:aryl-alcohol dehydrogenase
MKITAAVAEERSAPFTIQTLDLDAHRPDEILVRVVGAGICQTDLSILEHDVPPLLPAVLGHEGAGVVEQIGSRVTKVQPGDSVVITFVSCGECVRCLRGEPGYCANMYALNFMGRRGDGSHVLYRGEGRDARAVTGRFFGQSCFATYALASERNVVKVPTDMALESLGPLGCSVLTGAGAVMNGLRAQAGASIAVFGVGAVGMSAVMAARAVGCTTIIAVDINPERLALAQALGATHAIQAARATETVEIAPVRAIQEITRGGADYSLEATGLPSVLRQAVEALTNRGVCGAVGVASYEEEFTLNMNSIVSGRAIRGILVGDSVPDLFIPALIELHRQGRFAFDQLIRYYPLREINQAADDVRRGATIKAVLRMA